MDRTDAELIADHHRGSQTALATLIRRHVDLVYAAAVRSTGDPGLADDVTQAVFIVLARKARSLRSHATVAGWLIVVTRQIARTAIRGRSRRRRHEHAAARPETSPMARTDTSADDLSRMLDQALIGLRATDRDAIALRYLQARSLADIGQLLGISEEAARKRVARGVERLRQSFARRGVAMGAAGMPAIFSASPAPAETLARIVALPLGPVSGAVDSLSKGMLRMLAIKQTAVILAALGLIAIAVVAVTVVAQSTPANPPAAAPIAATKPSMLTITTTAIQLKVTDVEANIAFFEKVGFHQRWADTLDATGRLPGATVDSGEIRMRLIRVADPPQPSDSMIPFFWIDGGSPALAERRDAITERGVAVGPLADGGATLRQFTFTTPDGYTIGFYSLK